MPNNNEIVQRIGFDVAQALTAIKQLDSAFKQHGDTLESVAKLMRGSSSRMQSDMRAIERQSASSMSSSTKHVERFTTSLALLSRIAFTQFVVRGMTQVRNAVSRASSSFVDFAKVLAETQAIAPEIDVDKLGSNLKKLSNQFNIPLLEAARSEYELISAGFSDAGDRSKIMAAGVRLAKLGVADLEKSTDLLSSALNAYSADADQAGEFARVFFGGVDKGKVTIDQLSSSFAKIAPAARTMNVSVEEATAALSALTTRGVTPSEAATQVNSLLAAFIKPSEDMEKALKALGVQSGQLLIQQRGLAGAIDAVIGTTDGSAASVGKLFRNQRALRGILTLTADGLKTFNEHLESLRELTQKEFEARFLNRMDSDVERATAVINKFTNATILGLGGGLIETAAAFDKVTGSVNGLADIVEKFFRVLTGGGVKVFSDELNAALRNAGTGAVDQVLIEWNKFIAKTEKDNAEILARAKVLAQQGKALPNGAKSVEELERNLAASLDTKRVLAFDDAISKSLAGLTEANTDLSDEGLTQQMNAVAFAISQMGKQASVSQAEIQKVRDVLDNVSKKAPLLDLPDFGTSLGFAEKALQLIELRSGVLNKPAEAAKQVANATGQAAANTQRMATAAEQAAASLQNAAKPLAQRIGRSIVAGDLMPRVIQAGERPLQPGEQPQAAQAEKIATSLQKTISPAAQFADSMQRSKAPTEAVATALDRSATPAQVLATAMQNGASPAQAFALAFQQAQTAAETLPTALADAAASGLTAAIEQGAIGIQSMVDLANQLTTAFANAAAAAAQVASAGTSQGKMHGGLVRLASGGMARGTDTIPAMLSPGEFVVNAKSARQFHSQLVALNSAPVHRSEGGAVDNSVNIGDINVSGARAPEATARVVIDQIRREVRRGTRTF